MSTFSNNLKTFRKLNGLTQQRFSEMTGIGRPTVGAYKEGRAEPQIGRFLQICLFYNMPPHQFYSFDFAGKISLEDKVKMGILKPPSNATKAKIKRLA